MSEGFPSLPNIEFLLEGNGAITIGRIGPIPCAVTAVDDDINVSDQQPALYWSDPLVCTL